jgi:hypothetical protein
VNPRNLRNQSAGLGISCPLTFCCGALGKVKAELEQDVWVGTLEGPRPALTVHRHHFVGLRHAMGLVDFIEGE